MRELMPPAAVRNACALAASGFLHALLWLAAIPVHEPPSPTQVVPLRVSFLDESRLGQTPSVTAMRPPESQSSVKAAARGNARASARASRIAGKLARSPNADAAVQRSPRPTSRPQARATPQANAPRSPTTSIAAKDEPAQDEPAKAAPEPTTRLATAESPAVASGKATSKPPLTANVTSAETDEAPRRDDALLADDVPAPEPTDDVATLTSAPAPEPSAVARAATPQANAPRSPTTSLAAKDEPALAAPEPATRLATAEPRPTEAETATSGSLLTANVTGAETDEAPRRDDVANVTSAETDEAPRRDDALLADDVPAPEPTDDVATLTSAPAPRTQVEEVSEATEPEPRVTSPEARSEPERDTPDEREASVERETSARAPRARRRGQRRGAWVTFVRTEGVGDVTSDPNATAIGDRNVRVDVPSRALADTTRGLGDTPGSREILPLDRVSTTATTAMTPPAPGGSTSPSRRDGLGLAGTRAVDTPAEEPATASTPPAVTLPDAEQAVTKRPVSASPGIARSPGASVTLVDEPAPKGTVVARARGAARSTSTAAPVLTRVTTASPTMPSEAAPATDLHASDAVSVLTPKVVTDTPAAAVDTPHTDEPAPTSTPPPQAVTPRGAERPNSPRPAAAWSDLAVVAETVPLGERTKVSVRDDPVGHWMIGVDDAIRATWRYPAAVRARGVEGNVVVTFRVKRNGKVVDARIVTGSGDPYLDVAALAAVPAKVPPLPRKAPRSVEIRYIFRYRAP